MQKFCAILLTFASAAALAASAFAQNEPVVIYDQNTPIESIRAQGVTMERLDDGALSIANGSEDPWPGVHFTGDWNLAAYSTIEVTLESTRDKEFTLFFRMDSKGTDPATLEGAITERLDVPPREKKVWKITLPKSLNTDVRQKLFAMRGKPGGIKTDGYSVDAGAKYNHRELVAFRPFVVQNGEGNSWKLISIVALPDPGAGSEEYLSWGPDKFFPMVDQFGQFMHKDWPGKTHSLDELRAQIKIEDADLDANQPTEFNEYGGWKNGPQLEATGSFRTEKIDGVWYFVDPLGNLFWSNGVDCVGHMNAITPVSDREFYFCDAIPTRPDPDNELSQFLGTSSSSVNNYYVGYGEFYQYNFAASNLYMKFGDDWVAKEKELIKRRLRSWGLNTIGNWSDMNVVYYAKVPYTATVNSSSRKIEGSSGYWGKFVDPFDPGFKPSVVNSLKHNSRTVEDPYCIGYFVDNEISWGGAGSLSRAALSSPADQPVKQAYIAWLQEKYETIDKFNAAWDVDVASWDVLASEPFETPKNDAANADSDAFYTVICEKYFEGIVDVIHEHAPGKLYLGCRFAWTNDLAKVAAQKYCDVVSYNFYQREVGSYKPVEGVDKPVIIGEFHFGALDRGMFHTGLGPCKDQNERAQAYENYVKSALGNPWIIGAHWFQYGDQAVTGRFDGENYQIGLVDVCDRPYEETIDAVRRVGYNMYQIRQETAKRN